MNSPSLNLGIEGMIVLMLHPGVFGNIMYYFGLTTKTRRSVEHCTRTLMVPG